MSAQDTYIVSGGVKLRCAAFCIDHFLLWSLSHWILSCWRQRKFGLIFLHTSSEEFAWKPFYDWHINNVSSHSHESHNFRCTCNFRFFDMLAFFIAFFCAFIFFLTSIWSFGIWIPSRKTHISFFPSTIQRKKKQMRIK